jgi:hypothetical protein
MTLIPAFQESLHYSFGGQLVPRAGPLIGFRFASTRRANTARRSRSADTPGLCVGHPPKRAQGMPGARCTRGLVCQTAQKRRTRAYRFSGGIPASPAQWLYGLLRALPGDEFVFVTVISRISGFARPVEQNIASARLDASNGRQDHTASPYATRLRQRPKAACPAEALAKTAKASFVSSRRKIAHGVHPALRYPARLTLRVHRIPRPTYVTIMIRPSIGTGRVEL